MSHAYPYPGAYLVLVRRANVITAAGGTVRLFWSSPDLDAAGWRREFRASLHKRINRKGGLVQQGRKWDADYQRALRFEANAVRAWHTRRVRFGFNRFRIPELQARYGAECARQWVER